MLPLHHSPKEVEVSTFAARQGIEPRPPGSEPSILPLNYRAKELAGPTSAGGPGFEPGTSRSERGMLPTTPSPNGWTFGVRGGIRTHTVQFLKLASPAVGLHAHLEANLGTDPSKQTL